MFFFTPYREAVQSASITSSRANAILPDYLLNPFFVLLKVLALLTMRFKLSLPAESWTAILGGHLEPLSGDYALSICTHPPRDG